MNALNPEEIKSFKQRLQREREQLRAAINTDAHASDNKNFDNMAGAGGGARDPGDDSVAMQLSDLAISSMEKQGSRLREIENALKRIDEGSYGECLDCGGDIPRARLEAYPTARRCTQCQSRRENLYSDATPSL